MRKSKGAASLVLSLSFLAIEVKDEVWYVVRSRDVVHKRGCLGYRSLCWDGVCHFIYVGFWDPVGSEVMIPLPYPDFYRSTCSCLS